MMWLVIGLVLGVFLIWLVRWMSFKGIAFKWYEWVIGAIGVALLLFTLQNFMGSFEEREPRAAYTFLLVTGLPALILIIVAARLGTRHKVSA
jgi:hypothetical protein